MNKYRIHQFLEDFLSCVSWLHAAKSAPSRDADFLFYKKPAIPFKAFTMSDIGINDENQILELPRVNRSVRARQLLEDCNELERWLNARGVSMRERFYMQQPAGTRNQTINN
jgi:hypothetical protein